MSTITLDGIRERMLWAKTMSGQVRNDFEWLLNECTTLLAERDAICTWTPRKDGLGSLPNHHSLEIVHNYPGGGGQPVIVGKHTGIDCLTPANAALIAAAPAMYEAACKVLADWERYTVSSMCNHTLHGIADLRAAIAQAEGDAQESGKICSKFSHWDEPKHNCPLCEKESGK